VNGIPSNSRGLARLALAGAIAIALVTIAVRFTGLGRESLWLDEGFTWRLTTLSPDAIIAASRTDVHPPLYPLLERLVVAVAGDREWALRLLSAVASSFSVLFAARLAKRAFGLRAAFGAAVLVALSAFQVHYAQEARAYALFGMLSLASADALLSVLEHGRGRARAAWIVATVALLYVHAHALFVVLAEALAVGWAARRREGVRAARPLVVPALVVAAAFLPWAGDMASQVERVARGFWIARPGPFDLVRTLVEFAGSPPAAVLLGALAVLGFVRPPRPEPAPRPPARALVVLLAVVPLLVPFVASWAGPPVYLTRAALAASLALAIVAAAGWAALPRWPRAVLGLLALLACAPPLVDAHRLVHKEPWRDAVSWIERQAHPDDLVLVTAPWYRDGVFAYYLKRRDLVVERVPSHEGPVTPQDAAALRAQLASHPRAWLVRARADDPHGLLPATLAEGRVRVAEREWSVAPTGPSRLRRVRALDVFCYAAPDSSPPSTTSRPAGR